MRIRCVIFPPGYGCRCRPACAGDYAFQNVRTIALKTLVGDGFASVLGTRNIVLIIIIIIGLRFSRNRVSTASGYVEWRTCTGTLVHETVANILQRIPAHVEYGRYFANARVVARVLIIRNEPWFLIEITLHYIRYYTVLLHRELLPMSRTKLNIITRFKRHPVFS